MRRVIVLGALLAVGTLSVGLAGQQQRAPLPELQKVKENFYILGSASPVDRSQFTGGNVSVFVTDAGVTVVDPVGSGSMAMSTSAPGSTASAGMPGAPAQPERCALGFTARGSTTSIDAMRSPGGVSPLARARTPSAAAIAATTTAPATHHLRCREGGRPP